MSTEENNGDSGRMKTLDDLHELVSNLVVHRDYLRDVISLLDADIDYIRTNAANRYRVLNKIDEMKVLTRNVLEQAAEGGGEQG